MQLGNVLVKDLTKDKRTVDIMNEFEESENGEFIYDTLKLENVFNVMYKGRPFKVSLFVKKIGKDLDFYYFDYTISDIKDKILGTYLTYGTKATNRLVNEVFKGVSKVDMPLTSNKAVIYDFDKPVRFCAQNKKNRTGYGSCYIGDNLVYEGTHYGETTDYFFVGTEYKR